MGKTTTETIPQQVTIGNVVIDVSVVLEWMKQQNRFVSSVEMRDAFDWPLRQHARKLMNMLAEKKLVVIHENPTRKRSWVYGLKGTKLPTAENSKAYKPPKTDKELQKGKFANNHKSPETPAKTEKAEKPKQETPKQDKPEVKSKATELDPIIQAKIKPQEPIISKVEIEHGNVNKHKVKPPNPYR